MVNISLVIFICESREHLLYNTINSFNKVCNYPFNKVILAIDGTISDEIIKLVDPDIVVQNPKRKGYVNNIIQALSQINAEYFFWLEDDWTFHQPIDLTALSDLLNKNPDWAEIILSQYGPLKPDFKVNPLGNNLYQTTFGFSANPALCNTLHIQSAFALLEKSPKGDKLGEDGFENFLTKTFNKESIKCVIIDPVDRLAISHEGYLESTPRNWHMTNSLESKTSSHLLTIPKPSFVRKLYMLVKLFIAFCKLGFNQLSSDKIYEYCFRIIASAKTIKEDD